jgi:transcriptional regulator with XRE-family HTH domain
VTTDETTADEAGEALARELKRLIDGSGRSLRTLGRDLNVSASTLSRATSGKVRPARDLALAIARIGGGDPEVVERLWTAAGEENRVVLPSGGPERELLRMTASALNAERQRQGLSLEKLAKTSGWSKSTLSTLLRGGLVPDMSLLQDVLQAMNLTDAEVGNWTARFARAAEKARQGDPAWSKADVEAVLVPLQTQFRRWRRALAATAVLAAAGLVTGGLALWSAANIPPPREPGPATTVTVGTPVPPGPKTAKVDVGLAGELASVFEQPRTDAKVTSTVRSSTWVELTCQVVTGTEFTDPGLLAKDRATSTKTWLKIAVHGRDLGYVPSIYLVPYENERPVLPPPACS